MGGFRRIHQSETDSLSHPTGTEDRPHLRVLVVEDDFGDYDAVSRALRRMQSYTSEHVRAKSLVEARHAVASAAFDVALIDFHLGADSGAQLLDELGGRAGKIVPILLTGRADVQVHRMAMRAGAISCINKDDLSSTLLETTFRYAFHNHDLEQQMHALLARLSLEREAAVTS